MKIEKKNSFIHKEIFFYQGNDIMILIPTVRYIDPNILLKQLSFKYNIKKNWSRGIKH
jgi:hypothetical protein